MLPETVARPRVAERDVAFELTFCSPEHGHPVRTVRCPTCGKDVEWKRRRALAPVLLGALQQIDLGEWASKATVPPSSPPDAPLDELDYQPPGAGEMPQR